ncbi:MAG TPA: hypothetical protein VNF99_18245 [Stellaceae bacterium]|nr:hypothetical protein [Stellaceae bacterium]
MAIAAEKSAIGHAGTLRSHAMNRPRDPGSAPDKFEIVIGSSYLRNAAARLE